MSTEQSRGSVKRGGSPRRPASFIRTSSGTYVITGCERSPRFVVVNPMHVMTLSRRSFGVKLAQRFQHASQKWFTHVILLSVLMCYCMAGAVIFKIIEGPYEGSIKNSVIDIRQRIVDQMYRNLTRTPGCNCPESQSWKVFATARMRDYQEQLLAIQKAGVKSSPEKRMWTFWGSMFYCGTVFTTIGYGNIAPSTGAGRVATILYASIGIPLLLTVLADLGKLFTRLMKLAFRWIQKFYETDEVRYIRQKSQKAAKTPKQFLLPWVARLPRFDFPATEDEFDDEVRPAAQPASEDVTKATNTTRVLPPRIARGRVKRRARRGMPAPPIPVSLVVAFLLIYMLCGSLAFSIFHEWTMFESFYFIFVSMSTIGFGDYVPEHPLTMMATFVYLLFGLALTSMCINVIQEKLNATFQKAKLHIALSLGLEPEAFQDEGLTTVYEDLREDFADRLDDMKRGSIVQL